MKSISSRRNPIVRRFREAAAGGSPEILLDGSHLVDEGVGAGLRILAAACSPSALQTTGMQARLERLRSAGVECSIVTSDVLEGMSPVRSPSGIVALAARPSLAFSRVLQSPPQLVLLAVDVQDPGNVGAIVRAAEAGGATGVVFAGASADPFGWKALRGSMGSSLRVPVVRTPTEEAVAAVRAAGLRLLATAPRGGRSLFEADLRRPVAILLGGEGPGLSDAVIEAADETVHIPMRGSVESLNVAVASALLVYEASRQRGRVG